MDLEIFDSNLPKEKFVEGYISSAFARKNFAVKFKVDKLEIVIMDTPIKYLNFLNKLTDDEKIKNFLTFVCSIYSINNILVKPITLFDNLESYFQYINDELFSSKPLFNICKNCYLKFNEILNFIIKEVFARNFF